MFEDNYRHRGMRNSLVRTISEKGISNEKVLAAIEKIPRHFFFENAFVEHAYQDKAFPIGHGQTISQPYTVAFQTQLLDVKKGDKVLEVGMGSGYQCCILMELGAKVYTIEYNKSLYQKTKKMLPQMGYVPLFFYGDGSKGLAKFAPFDKILVTAGAPYVPSILVNQLSIGGKLVIPVGTDQHQRMVCITKISKNDFVKKEFDYFSFVPLRGEHGWKN
ncbi:MAG: protein-L-isoaspartate(D-aspartate) O-methyltransferase [Bacteroidetes bacterium]|nr:protein-L-isoaspartate(D-aspartate) O-methyltransferase [Bacteroidota bacterium]